MAGIETIGILDEIQVLVSDRLQVVSYKWLSRNFLVPSNVAKKLLEEFVEKHGDQLEVVYALSGWLKSNPSNYHIRLVSQSKLAEAKGEFEENFSIQVYSVQTFLPKDPTVIWNDEFVQAEELFKQSAAVDNCLRDNRFCGVLNSTVKRNAGGVHATPTSEVKSSGVLGQCEKVSVQQTSIFVDSQQKKAQESGPSSSMQSLGSAKVVKIDNNSTGAHERNAKPAEGNRNIPQLPVKRKKSLNDKSTSWSENKLFNMWYRASKKPIGDCAPSKANDSLASSAGSQMCSGGDGQDASGDDDVNVKWTAKGEATRKRRVVFYDSDDEDDIKEAITLASPDISKMGKMLSSKQSSNSSNLEKKNSPLDEEEGVANVMEKGGAETSQALKEESSAPTKVTKSSVSSQDGNVDHASAVHTNLGQKRTDTAPVSPKRRKAVKTWIDEHGKEVTEVFWESEETHENPHGSQTTTEAVISRTSASNRQSVKKSPAVGNIAPENKGRKGGNKKAAKMDPKQGNILSFFKKI